ncbi:MAG TPA: TraB/GumN family protein [Sphingomicrobium sp.]|nr:TraB/GumN family protein [Sphingomicrobium sp.]
MGIFPTLLGVAVAAAAIPAAPTPAPLRDPVKPALWLVTDGDTTIYLFGTFHALDGSANWFKDGVRQAFHQSDQLVLETLVPPAGAAPLSIPKTAVPTRKTGPTASFAASTRMVMNATRNRGMSTAQGADAALRLAAEGSGKPVAGLESFEFQINMFSSLAATPQPQVEIAGPSPMLALSAVLAKLQDAWVRGDMATFVPMLEQMRETSPLAYRTMFVDRNARWAGWIAERLRQPGTVFVAVGAGHLAGRDSVQAQLAAKGVGSFRIN